MDYPYPRATASPVRHLFPAIGEVFNRIAPEHEAELRSLTRDVTMEVVDSSGFECKAMSAFRLIVLSTRTVE